MIKKKNKLAACILLSIFLLTTFATLEAKPVNASKVAMTWGHLQRDDPEPDEEYWESVICQQIDGMFPSNSWSHQNAYHTLTTSNNVALTLDYISNPNNGVTWATTWWVGDFLHPTPYIPAPYGHFACYGHGDSSNDIWDNCVNLHATNYGTQTSKHYFTFMWTCANGGLYWTNQYGGWQNISGITWPTANPQGTPSNPNTVYGYFDNVYYTGAVGMPLAWTNRTDMNLNGYTSSSGSYTFIGWENNSPFMKNTPPSGWTSTNLQYIYFAYYFYRYALGLDNYGVHGTIRQSLNYAAEMTFGEIAPNVPYNFGTSVLNVGQWVEDVHGWFYCKMRVLGNGQLVLPY